MKKGVNLIMNVWCNVWLFILLLFSIYGSMRSLRETDDLGRAARGIAKGFDDRGRKNDLKKRKDLRMRMMRENLPGKIDRALVYSMIKRKYPGLSAEKFSALVIAICCILLIAFWSAFGLLYGLLAVSVFVSAVYVFIRCLEISAMKKTGEDLPKLLDLLSSFASSGSISSGIFGEISIYMDEPLRSALDECSQECKMSGDVSLAMLSLADRIEHPQFKQLIRNMEITSRHSDDITGLVAKTRRGLRDYLRESSQRKTMLRESAINMLLLMVMSLVVLVITTSLSETGLGPVLFGSIPGRVTLAVMAGVCLMYFKQAAALYK